MTQPRKEQVKDLKTKILVVDPGALGITLTAVDQLSTTILNNGITTDYDTLIGATVTHTPNGSQENLRAVLQSPVLEPYSVNAGESINVVIPTVIGGNNVVVTFLSGDLVNIGGVPKLTAARAAARINATFAGIGVSTPVASSRGGYITFQSADAGGPVVGNTASITISDSTPTIVTKFGFGAVNTITALGILAPQRGIITQSSDGLGGVVQLRYPNGAPVLSQTTALLNFGQGKFFSNIQPGFPVYGRVTWTPGPHTNGEKFVVSTYAYILRAPTLFSSGANFASVLPGQTVTITISDSSGTRGFTTTFGTVTSPLDMVNAINAAWNSAYGGGVGVATATNPEPYAMGAADNFFIKVDGVTTANIHPLGNTAAAVAAAVQDGIDNAGAPATASVFTDFNGLKYLRISSNTSGGTSSKIEIIGGNGPFGSQQNTATLDKIGFIPGVYQGSTIASLFGGAEIQFTGWKASTTSTILISGTTGVMTALGFGAVTSVSANATFIETPVSTPSIPNSGSPLAAFPEVMEFGEVPQNLDDMEQRFLKFEAGSVVNPAQGARNAGQPIILDSSGKLDPRMMPDGMSNLTADHVTLGSKLNDNISSTNPLIPRMSVPYASAFTFTLIWESNPGPTIAAPATRMYSRANHVFWTINAFWDGAAWNKDIGGQIATKLDQGNNQVIVASQDATVNTTWVAWPRNPVIINADASAGMMNLGGGFNAVLADQLKSRLRIPFANVNIGDRTLLEESTPATGINQVIRKYSFRIQGGDTGTITTHNAAWNGTQWSKDIANSMAFGHFEYTSAGSPFIKIDNFRTAANNASWLDTEWVEYEAKVSDGVSAEVDPQVIGYDYFSSLMSNTLYLGKNSSNINMPAAKPRIRTGTTAFGATRTLLWESNTDGFASITRVYTSVNNGGWEFTNNAKWDEGLQQWIPDSTSSNATKFTLFAAGVNMGWREDIHQSTNANWNDTYDEGDLSWTSSTINGWDQTHLAQYLFLSPPQGSAIINNAPLAGALYQQNIIRSWGRIFLNAGTPNIQGFNCPTASIMSSFGNSFVRVTTGTGVGTGAMVLASVEQDGRSQFVQVYPVETTENTFDFYFLNTFSGGNINPGSGSSTFSFSFIVLSLG